MSFVRMAARRDAPSHKRRGFRPGELRFRLRDPGYLPHLGLARGDRFPGATVGLRARYSSNRRRFRGKKAYPPSRPCLFLTANIMMISFAVYSGLFSESSRSVLRYFSYPLLVMAGVVLFYTGLPIFQRGLAALRYRSPSMDTLIALGASSAYLYSAVQVTRGSPHLYFDTASMLVTFVLFGRYAEILARERVAGGIGEIRRVTQGKVRVEEGGRQRWVAADFVQSGDGSGQRRRTRYRSIAASWREPDSSTGLSSPGSRGPWLSARETR